MEGRATVRPRLPRGMRTSVLLTPPTMLVVEILPWKIWKLPWKLWKRPRASFRTFRTFHGTSIISSMGASIVCHDSVRDSHDDKQVCRQFRPRRNRRSLYRRSPVTRHSLVSIVPPPISRSILRILKKKKTHVVIVKAMRMQIRRRFGHQSYFGHFEY